MIKQIVFALVFFNIVIFSQNQDPILSSDSSETEILDFQKSEEYAADTIDAHAGYIACKFGDKFFEEWQLKYLRHSVAQWLQERSLQHVYIDVVNPTTNEVEYRTSFDIEYKNSFREDLWRDLSKLRRDAHAFSKENSEKSYKVTVLVGFNKKSSDAEGWQKADDYPKLNENSQIRVQAHNAVEVGGISIDASTIGVVIISQ